MAVAVAFTVAVFGTIVLAQAVVPSEISGVPVLRETSDWAGGVYFTEVNQATGRISFCVRAGICGYGYVIIVPCGNTSVSEIHKIRGGSYIGPGYHTVYVNMRNAYAVLVVLTDTPLFAEKCCGWPWIWGSRQYPRDLTVLRPRNSAVAARTLTCPSGCVPCSPCPPICAHCNPCWP